MMLRAMRGLVVQVAITGMILAVGGCAASQTKFQASEVHAPRPLERLDVFVSIPSSRHDRGVYHGFQRRLRDRLATCGVTSRIVYGAPPPIDDSAPHAATPPSPPRLVIGARSGDLTTITYVDWQTNIVLSEGNFGDLELHFHLGLFEMDPLRLVWRAIADLHVERPGLAAGEEFADAVLARLRSDRVLTRCP